MAIATHSSELSSSYARHMVGKRMATLFSEQDWTRNHSMVCQLQVSHGFGGHTFLCQERGVLDKGIWQQRQVRSTPCSLHCQCWPDCSC